MVNVYLFPSNVNHLEKLKQGNRNTQWQNFEKFPQNLGWNKNVHSHHIHFNIVWESLSSAMG